MQLDKQLTGNSGIMAVAGLAIIDEYNEDVPSSLNTARAIQDWADELQDVEGRVEVSIQNLEKTESGDTEKALVARAVDTDVACVLAPVVPEDDGGVI
ncbi:hypothetical protein DJ84_18255 [Halorubrum ezzemoulense]|nr:hypothetical protein DJ84_18255 [Halorubrum ezzemoulense]